jgi:hypothetical protein
MYRNQWRLCLEVYKNTLIEHTNLTTSPGHLGVYKTWSLVCRCKNLLNPSAVTYRFCLYTLQRSHLSCVYTVHNTLTGYEAGHQVRTLHSSIYYSWMSPEWTTVCHPKHGLKKFQSSPVVWGRRRHALSLALCRRMFNEATPSSGKHQ